MSTDLKRCARKPVTFTLIVFLSVALNVQTTSAQRQKNIGVAVMSNNAGFPFSEFGDLFKSPLHPGIEFSYGINWRRKPKHDWFQQVRLGYFYHRYVQHGIPLYTSLGYRYKLRRFLAEASLGAGYLHSIPATAQFKLSDNGEYKNSKGIGRMQGMVTFDIGTGYVLNPRSKTPFTAFATYQQRIQTPFIRSYVPLMPYNNLLVGLRKNLKIKTR